jgi:hypothetical protein
MKGTLRTHIIALLSLGLLTGCTTFAANRYSVNANTVAELRQFAGHPVAVGAFASLSPGQSDLSCRGGTTIKTPDGEPFSDFVRKGLVDEMKIAGIYSNQAPVVLTGTLTHIDFGSVSGNWQLSLIITSSNGQTLFETESFGYSSSFDGDAACNQTAQALMPAVQDLIGKIVHDPRFADLIHT